MDKAKLSRREILAGLAVTGSSGALVGSGTGALFSDEETFTNNSITGSKTAAGVVTVDVDPNPSLSSSGDSVDFTVSVPDTEEQRENPAFVCVQTNSCPEDVVDSDGDSKDSPDRLRVQLVLECDPDRTLLTGSLREVLDVLNRGLVLSCDDDPCLDPGESELTLRLDAPTNLGIEEYNFEFALDFLAEQCRVNEPTVPSEPGLFDLLGTCPTDEECPPTGGKEISFIAFCNREPEPGDPLNPSIEVHRTNDKGDVTSITWETDEPVDYVVMFGANNWTLYDYRDETPKSGVATTGGYTDYNEFYETEGKGKNKTLGTELLKNDLDDATECQPQSCPCQVAEDILNEANDTFPSGGRSVKRKKETFE